MGKPAARTQSQTSHGGWIVSGASNVKVNEHAAARVGDPDVCILTVPVVHVGGRSFVGQKNQLSPRNTAILLDRHPHYTEMVEQYIRSDPLAPIRDAAQSVLVPLRSRARGILHVIHDHGGGTEMHVRALIDASRQRWRH